MDNFSIQQYKLDIILERENIIIVIFITTIIIPGNSESNVGARVKVANLHWLAHYCARPLRAGGWLVGLLFSISSGTEPRTVFYTTALWEHCLFDKGLQSKIALQTLTGFYSEPFWFIPQYKQHYIDYQLMSHADFAALKHWFLIAWVILQSVVGVWNEGHISRATLIQESVGCKLADRRKKNTAPNLKKDKE